MPAYIGRFAPSPTGLLHAGSLIGALASYLDAKAHQGTWLVRMEDLDPPREQAGAAQAILDCLIAHGLKWDGEVLYQSQRHRAYQKACDQLLEQQHAFFCHCSRKQLGTATVYPGHCRQHFTPGKTPCAIRCRIEDRTIGFDDLLLGPQQQQLASEVGDFIIKRKDQLFAYQLAVVVDDAFQGITHIVRGSDLLCSTPRQIYLQQLLGFTTPAYLHFPVITHQDGQKLSKQSYAPAIEQQSARQNLLAALRFLNQTTPPAAAQQDCQQILSWSAQHWSRARIPSCLSIAE